MANFRNDPNTSRNRGRWPRAAASQPDVPGQASVPAGRGSVNVLLRTPAVSAEHGGYATAAGAFYFCFPPAARPFRRTLAGASPGRGLEDVTDSRAARIWGLVAEQAAVR